MTAATSERRQMIESRVPWALYAETPGISITRLKEIAKSPLHYRYALTHPKESPAMTLGTAVHAAVLEPERFDREWVQWGEVGDIPQRRGKAWDAFEDAAAANGKQILRADEYATVRTMQAAVRGHPTASKYLDSGEPEVTMQWIDGGVRCKGRVDWLTRIDGKPVLVGLKTARDHRPFIFGSQAAKLQYPSQWAHYRSGYEIITGTVAKLVEIVVENAPPHDVVVYTISADVLLVGEEERQRMLDVLAKCAADDRWPGLAEDHEVELTLPSWVYAENDDIAGLELEV